jgi:hypothetical protein
LYSCHSVSYHFASFFRNVVKRSFLLFRRLPFLHLRLNLSFLRCFLPYTGFS